MTGWEAKPQSRSGPGMGSHVPLMRLYAYPSVSAQSCGFSGTGPQLTSVDTAKSTTVVLGGTPLTGGIGSMTNTVVGALIIAMLLNGMVILGIPSEIQIIVQGLVVVGAVYLSLERGKIGIIK